MNTLKERLTKQCNFLEIYEADLDKGYPKKEMGFLRCDFDGGVLHGQLTKKTNHQN